MKKLLCSVFALATLTTAAPLAVADGGAGTQAGCGLGSIIFGPKPGMTQIFAATTNASFGTQTFGISSGTSNCGAPAAAGVASVKSFTATNRQSVAKDIARGAGETIVSLTTLGGCRDAKAVGASLQRNFKVIFSAAKVSDDVVADRVVAVLKADASLSCSKLI
jgi:hypothetical protein